ncbi:PT domain-containing protein [Herbaspirillum sp. YR522]|uniref:PT domain-containing protein n=1 Tax=Herbaspirillum sp. YR522 TaxID=1144342 RepID=UPI0012FB0A28
MPCSKGRCTPDNKKTAYFTEVRRHPPQDKTPTIFNYQPTNRPTDQPTNRPTDQPMTGLSNQ